jgi:hypothetical protein
MFDMKYWVLLLTFTIISTGLFSQDLPDITTDRPDQSESSSTVPKKTLQIETGFVLQGDKTTTTDTRNLDFFNTLFRYGVFDYFVNAGVSWRIPK